MAIKVNGHSSGLLAMSKKDQWNGTMLKSSGNSVSIYLQSAIDISEMIITNVYAPTL